MRRGKGSASKVYESEEKQECLMLVCKHNSISTEVFTRGPGCEGLYITCKGHLPERNLLRVLNNALRCLYLRVKPLKKAGRVVPDTRARGTLFDEKPLM